MVRITPYAYAEMEKSRRRVAFAIRSEDGVVVAASKWVWGCSVWHCTIEWFIKRWFFIRRVTSVPMARRRAKSEFEKGVEVYWLVWTFVVLAFYGLSSWAASDGPLQNRGEVASGVRIALWLAAAVCAFRTLEIASTSIRLHFLEHYETDKPGHALLLTFLAFFQVTVCFAVIYWLEAVSLPDSFGDCPLWSSRINALYFSAVTMATLGYGDFAPQHWVGKCTVLAQVFIGLLLIVVAFQRVLGGIAKPE